MAFLEYKDLIPFTPIIVGGSSPGVGTYTAQEGFYHLVGNIVFIAGDVSWSAHTGTGNLLIDGLPFICLNQAGYDPEVAVRTESLPWPTSSTMVYGELVTGLAQIQIHGTRTNGAAALLQMNGAGTIHFAGFYHKG